MELVEEYVHTLSQIEFHRGSGRDLPVWSNATQRDRDHVASLDGLALLFVFSPKGDVAATSYWRSADELKLLWAKNQPVNDHKQLRYIEDLLKNVKEGTQTQDLLSIVIPMCIGMIFYRIKKLANSFGVSQNNLRQDESNLWQFDGTKRPHQKLEAALKKGGWLKADWLKTGESTVHLLDSFTRLVGKTKKTSEVRVFFKYPLFRVVCHIGRRAQ